jgi:restriction system protein
MTAKITIVEAIQEVMLAAGKPMTVSEVYEAIVSKNLYTFKADQPIQIVRNQIRRHCKGLDFQSASDKKHFELLPDGKYYVLQKPVIETSLPIPVQPSPDKKADLISLKHLHQKYVDEFRYRVLEEIKKLDPIIFERFCRNLLKAYGFQDVVVTGVSKDGGIDGYGCLKVGFTYFNVAFQCKRWTKRTIGRPDINQFRGDIQGQYEMGIFFTTANFSPEAERNSLKSGAVPVVLINGLTIVDIMIENEFGIETEQLPVYNLALDLAVADEN